jgi:PRTRC genetic system protein B
VNAHLALGNNITVTLQSALLIYGDNSGKFFVTRHDVINGNDKQPPALGPAQALTSTFLKHLAEGFGRMNEVAVLPENIVANGDQLLAWWTPAAKRLMFFKESNDHLAHLNGRMFPHPALLFVAYRHSLHVRALQENRRPTAETPLFVAPYWNVSDDGVICQGSMRSPDNNDVASHEIWQRAFFESAFTHANTRRITDHPDGFEGLWKELADSEEPFPSQLLIPTKETLESYLKMIHH